MSLLLHLSNSASIPGRSVVDDDDDGDEGLSLLRKEVLDVKEIQKQKALEIRRLLAEGEDNDWSPPHSSGTLIAHLFVPLK